MARRSSARIRSRNSSTPKRVSLSHDAPTRTPRTAPVKLSALQESDEMPGAFPQSASPPALRPVDTPSKFTSKVPVHFGDVTPKHTTPIKPSDEEMHPKQHQQSTAKPLDEARWLGFATMGPHTEPSKRVSKIATLQATPTRVTNTQDGVDSPRVQFTFRREQSLELSPEAKKLMNEKREEAAKIREQMIANGEAADGIADSALGRKIATPKGNKGRFSDAHTSQFKKMDSIANHASSFRSGPSKPLGGSTPAQSTAESYHIQLPSQSATKSLKRSPSKAQLDEPDRHLASTLPRGMSDPKLSQSIGHLSRSASSKTFHNGDTSQSGSPAKRVKRCETDDASKVRPSSSGSEMPTPATPRPKVTTQVEPLYPDLSSVASPTQASLARAASVRSAKSSKIPAPPLARSPSKPNMQEGNRFDAKTSTPLLARSPSKASLFSSSGADKSRGMISPLLMRSPTKGSAVVKTHKHSEDNEPEAQEAPLLSRSPLKMSVAKSTTSDTEDGKASWSTALLARSPAKFTLPAESVAQSTAETPSKPSSNRLMGRLNLLRPSPVKSILRSPHRLYSDDPAKVAAGTHLATPPKVANSKPGVAATAPVEKRVDFSSSTKARYERAQSELSTPSKGPTHSPNEVTLPSASPMHISTDYASLPSEEKISAPGITPQKRRQTAAPTDFTFRAGEHAIIFGQSPNAPHSAAVNKRSSTIRHVSAEPTVPINHAFAPLSTAKKRKFDFENEKAADSELAGAASDKENANHGEESERPVKRAKPSAPSPAPSKPATKRATLGVKPRKGSKESKEKKPSTISRARLDALSQPKRRG